ncbi:MAG: AtpZ/AtpI family protein [Bacillota bacterium]
MDAEKNRRKPTGASQQTGNKGRSAKPYWSYARYVNFAFSFGVTMAASILLGLFGGKWLDEKLGTSPWLLVAGLLMGVGIAFKSLFDELKALERPPLDEDDKDDKNNKR